jgi:hypothetical protein
MELYTFLPDRKSFTPSSTSISMANGEQCGCVASFMIEFNVHISLGFLFNWSDVFSRDCYNIVSDRLQHTSHSYSPKVWVPWQALPSRRIPTVIVSIRATIAFRFPLITLLKHCRLVEIPGGRVLRLPVVWFILMLSFSSSRIISLWLAHPRTSWFGRESFSCSWWKFSLTTLKMDRLED